MLWFPVSKKIDGAFLIFFFFLLTVGVPYFRMSIGNKLHFKCKSVLKNAPVLIGMYSYLIVFCTFTSQEIPDTIIEE